MPYMRERTCFHSDLTAKMYLNFDVLSIFSKGKIPGAHPHYIQNYFFLGSGQISTMTLEMSKTAEFRGFAELLHVCLLHSVNQDNFV